MDKEDSPAESNDSESEDSGVPATDQDTALAEKEKVWLPTYSIEVRLSNTKPDRHAEI